ncbi:RIP metalloprotease RseP [Candidatus Falkowbacteria bacterium]|nr:RIP metalloprotease RseP [Candidatus Falkowbacteria bacterium]
MLFTIIVFILVLGILVLVHELGHFFTARKFGCKVEEFGLGFPPRAKQWTSKKSGINYSLNWLPIGGFVKIKGEDGENRVDQDSFGAKPAWQRAIILCAGVTMNLVLAAVLLSIGFGIGLPSALPDDLSELGNVRVVQEKIQVYRVADGLPAAAAGLQTGDEIVSLDGQQFSATAAVSDYIATREGEVVNVALRRGGEDLAVSLIPEYYEAVGQSVMGVELIRTGLVRYPWYLLPWKGVEATYSLTIAILTAFYTLLHNLIAGVPVGAEIAGPVGIAALTGQMARLGVSYILQFVALLSINLAIINIVPFPALDGGRVLFLIIEKIHRRPVSQKLETAIHNAGFALLMLLMLFVTYRDIAKWGSGLWNKIFG